MAGAVRERLAESPVNRPFRPLRVQPESVLAKERSMAQVPVPPGEGGRLAALGRYAVLDTPPEEAFDRLARLAARLLETPIILICLVDADRLFLKARIGFAPGQVPRDHGFCAHAIRGDGVTVVEDATKDPRFAGNPFVTGAPAARFYAGAPLRTPERWPIGTLCAMDRAPRRPAPKQVQALTDLAALVVDQLELRRQAAERGRTEALLSTALDSLPFEFWVRDREHRCVLQNPVARALHRDLLGTLPDEPGLPAENAGQQLADRHRALAGETVRGQVTETVRGASTVLAKIVAPVRVGANGAQGFLLARPMPAEEVSAWAAAWDERRLHGPCLDLLRI